jgi:hypothetical protein
MTYASNTRIQQRYFPNSTSFPGDNTVPTAIHNDRMSGIDDFINDVIANDSGANLTDSNGVLSRAAEELYGMILDGKSLSLTKQQTWHLRDRKGTVAVVTANQWEHPLNLDKR